MNHLDLFSGIGGFSYAAQQVWGADHEIVSFVEIDPFCQKVLAKHWPTVPIISDIRDVTHERIFSYTGGLRCNTGGAKQLLQSETRIDLLTGGFPCQPFSCAGKRQGARDDRFLWPEMLRVIRELQPAWVIGENVAGIINMALDQVLTDLEGAGYQCQTFLIPACGVDAPHRRDRVWIVGHAKGAGNKEQQESHQRENGPVALRPIILDKSSNDQNAPNTTGNGLEGGGMAQKRQTGQSNGSGKIRTTADADTTGLQGGAQTRGDGENGQESSNKHPWGCNRGGCKEWLPEPSMGELVDGLSNGLVRFEGRVATKTKDRVNKLKALGNAIVPQCVMPIMQAIREIEDARV